MKVKNSLTAHDMVRGYSVGTQLVVCSDQPWAVSVYEEGVSTEADDGERLLMLFVSKAAALAAHQGIVTLLLLSLDPAETLRQLARTDADERWAS